MYKFGWLVTVFGVTGALLSIFALDTALPILRDHPVSTTGWCIVAAIGAVVTMLYRRTRD